MNSAATEPPGPQPSRGSRLWIVLVACVLLIGGAVAWWSTRTDDGPAAQEGPSERDRALQAKKQARATVTEREPATVGGRVVAAADKSGIEGAVVLLNRDALTQGVSAGPGQPAEPLTAVTDETGEWSLVGVPPGTYSLSATANGFLPGKHRDVRVVSAQQSADQRMDLALVAGGSLLSGVVTDIGGGPVEGVLMRVDDMEGVNMFGLRRVPVATATNEDGEYAINVGEGRYIISTYHPDYVATFRITHVVDGPRTENIELAPAGVVEGRVLTRKDRKPVADARVTFTDGRAGSTGGFRINMGSDGRVVTSDAGGKFRLTGLHSGVVNVNAWGRKSVTLESVAVPLGIGETVTGVELLVDTAYTVSGYVVPKDDPEAALEGVMVGIYTMKPPALLASSEPSEEDGHFEIVGVEPGSYIVGALTDGAIPTVMGGSVSVNDADVDDVLVELDAGVRLRGKVDPPEVADISVEIDTKDMGMGTMMDMFGLVFAGTRSAPDGTFEFGPVRPGKYTLKAKGLSGSAGRLEVDIPEGGMEGAVLPLELRASVSGVVLDQTGAPQSGVNVELVSTTPGQFDMMAAMSSGGVGRGSATNEQGRYVVKGLDPGKYLASVTDNRSRRVELAGDEPNYVEVEVAQALTGVDLTVVTRSGEISGTVVDSGGLPMGDVWVRAYRDVNEREFGKWVGPTVPPQDRPERIEAVIPKDDDDDAADGFQLPDYFAEPPVLTDEAGNFLIKGLDPAVQYTVTAEGDRGGQKAREENIASGSVVTLTLEALSSLNGVVKGGGTLTEYTVTLAGPADRSRRFREGDGSFSFDRLETGSYEVKVEAESGFGTAEIEIESGQDAKVTVELEGFAEISGTLVSAVDGEGIPGAMVLNINKKGGVDGEQALAMMTGGGATTGADGSFTIKEVKPGEGVIVFMDRDAAFSGGGGQLATEDYAVEGGETLDLGDIKGLPTSDIKADERGTLGLSTTAATWAKRPRPPGTDLDAEADADEGDGVDDKLERLWVRWVEVDGPAAAAGVEPGDEVLTIDDLTVSSLGARAADMKLGSAQVRVGQEIKLGLDRQGSGESATVEAAAKD